VVGSVLGTKQWQNTTRTQPQKVTMVGEKMAV
jgi:hypothetical protein